MIVSSGFPAEFTRQVTRRSIRRDPGTRSVTVLGPGLKSFQSYSLSFFSGSCRQPYSFVGRKKTVWVSKYQRKVLGSSSFRQVTVQGNNERPKSQIGT
jgi:hypothetical protein